MFTIRRRVFTAAAPLLITATLPALAQVATGVTATQARPFIGTWLFSMTNPAGSQQTVRIWDKSGALGASVQVGRFPPIEATALLMDDGRLVLSVSHQARPGLRENGQPLWAVLSLTLEGDTMHLAQMLERSETIKRGTGKQQPD